MIDPTKTAERQYEAIARVIEAEGFVKDKIVDALAMVISADLWRLVDQALLPNVLLNYLMSHGKEHGFSQVEHYTPLDPVPWDAVTTATKVGRE